MHQRNYFQYPILILSFCCVLLTACSSVIFQPNSIQYIKPEKNDVEFQDVIFKTENNLNLHGWFLPSRKKYSHGTILFLHGNAQNISAHIGSVYWLPYSGFNVFLFDYQGYGRSQGEPTLTGVQQDFHAALQWLINNPDIDQSKIIVYGQSLGGSIALHALSKSKYKKSIKGLIVDSSFTSYRSIAQDVLDKFWLTWAFQWPLSLLISNDYPAIEAAPKISPVPVMIIHSKDDETIPYQHGAALYQAALRPKYFWSLHDVKHIQIFLIEKNREIFVHHLLSMFDDSFPVIKKIGH